MNAVAQPSSPFLDDLLQRNARNSDRARQIAGNLTPAQMRWQPVPTSWSVGHCLEHLRISAALYFEPMETGLAKARAANLTGSPDRVPRHPLMGRALIWAISPKTKKRSKNPKKITPLTFNPETILQEFLDTQDHLAKVIASADGLNLEKARMRSPMNALFHLNLADAFEVLVAHAERHLNQAERVMQNREFPQS